MVQINPSYMCSGSSSPKPNCQTEDPMLPRKHFFKNKWKMDTALHACGASSRQLRGAIVICSRKKAPSRRLRMVKSETKNMPLWLTATTMDQF